MFDYAWNIAALPTALTALAMLAVGVFVLLRERSSSISLSFFLLALSIAGWLGSISALYWSANDATAKFWAHVCYLPIALIAPAIYHFTLSLLNHEQEYRRRIVLNWSCGLAFIPILVGSSTMVSGVYRYSWGYFPRLAPPAFLFLLYFGLSLGASLFHLVREKRKPLGFRQQQRVGQFVLAFSIGYVGCVDYLPAFGVPLYAFGYVPVAVFLLLAARTVLRHHLVDFTTGFAAEQIRATIPGALIVLDEEKTIRVVNRNAANLLGYDERELLGKSLRGIISDVSGNVSLPLGELESGDPRSVRLKRKDGTVVEVAISRSEIVDESGHPAGTVYVGVDVTELNSARREIEKLNRRNQLLLERAGDGIYGLDREGRGTFVNAAAARMLGYQAHELLGKSQHETIHHTRPDGTPFPPVECPIDRVVRDGESRSVSDDVFWRKDGTSFAVDYTAVPLVEDGRIAGAVVTFNDITDRKIAEAQRLTIARQEEANRAKDELLAMVSHDLRTPMAAILGWLHFIDEELRRDPRLTPALEAIEEAARTESRLIDELFDVARINAGRLQIERAPLELRSLVKRVVDSAESLIRENSLTVTLQQDHEEPLIVEGDSSRLQQVVWNLLSNSIKFTQRGGHVRITVSRGGATARITVEDDGYGIAPDLLPHVFDRYRQGDSSKGGLGLGLAIIKHVVELHGGTIAAASEGERRGSTFTVTLPVAR